MNEKKWDNYINEIPHDHEYKAEKTEPMKEVFEQEEQGFALFLLFFCVTFVIIKLSIIL